MGIDFCQVEGTPSMLIAVANLAKFQTAMYVSQNRPFLFVDEAPRMAVVPETMRVTTFGLGTNRRPVKLSITWPDGSVQQVTDLPVNRQILIEQAAESVEAR